MNRSALTVLRQGLAGAGASLLMFVVMEPSMRASELARLRTGFEDSAGGAATTLVAGALLGAFLAAGLTFAEELGTGRAARIAGRSLLAGMAGFVIGMVAIFCGAALFHVIHRHTTLMLGRSLGWALFGAGLGVAGGVVSISFAKIKQGFLGGAFGGLIGGFVFDMLPAFGDAASLSRLVGFTSMGLCIGLAISLVQEVATRAWVTVLTGRGEGKRYLLNKSRFCIGRAELADIPLYGDATLDRTQVVLENLAGKFAVQEVGQRPLMRVDGEPATLAWLHDNNIIEIGAHRLRFSLRGSNQPSRIIDHVPHPRPGASLLPLDAPDQQPVIISVGATTGSLEAMANPMPIALIAETGPHQGTCFRVPPFGARVGRSPDCEICLRSDGVVSRLHAELFPGAAGWTIRDSASRNGVTVCGERVEEARLHPGDLIAIGCGTYRVVCPRDQ